jgi:RNA ligase
MTTLQDLFDTVDLEQALSAGYVRTQTHSTRPFTIYNYTELAAYEGVWNPVTRQCRGLIAHSSTGEIIARPFPKFMNHGQDGAHVGDAGDRVVVTDKQDGSLGILYPVGNGRHAVATRGSFASDQALHATAVWQERYADIATIRPGWTYLFEIIYPGNRIVVDYGPLDDLVLLAAVHIDSGHSLPPDDIADWPGLRTETFAYASLAEAMAAPDRPGREGLVVHYVDANERIKIKQAEYVELHKLVTGMNERVVWEHLGAGKPLDELIAPLPDEFHSWVRGVADRLHTELGEIVLGAREAHGELIDSLPRGFTRKEYAERAALSPLRAWLFLLLDGRDPEPKIWRTLRPSGAVTMTSSGEDVA